MSATGDSVVLRDVVRTFMDEQVRVSYEQAERLRRAWQEVVPEELGAHCRVEELAGGVLTVAVDGPGYMHEFRLWKKELCSRLNNMAPRCAVRDIKTVIG